MKNHRIYLPPDRVKMNEDIIISAGGTSQLLPPEMEEEILCRLPVKSLVRFRCVSKAWRSMINQHRFARKHLSFAARPDNLSQRRMMLFNPAGPQLIFSFKERLLASCDGLLCVGVDNNRVYLWNPSLDTWRSVPDPIEPQKSFYHDCGANFTFSLGFDSATDDYKLVKFSTGKPVTWVFSLKSGTWIKLGGFSLLPEHTTRSCVFVNGSIYFQVRNIYNCPSRRQIQVFSYNLSAGEDKMYKEVALPERYPLYSPFWLVDHVRLAVLKGMLCVIALREHCLVLWAMKKDAAGWRKVLGIPLEQVFGKQSESMRFHVFFLYEGDEVLMGVASRGKTELLVCKENKVLSRQIVFNEASVIEQGFVHVETLLSPLHA